MEYNHFKSVIRTFISLLQLWLFFICCSSSTINNCSSTEREALISFKQSLKDPSSRLSSWGVGLNCCHWYGITCDFVSGRVTKIDLRNSLGFNRFKPFTRSEDFQIVFEEYKNSCLGGERISPSLLQLKYLNYLDLSLNNFEGAPIPYFFGMLTNLIYLNLSSAYFGGEIPHHLGNLSKLNYLDLSSYHPYYFLSVSLRAESLNWLSGLSSLHYLDLGHANLRSIKADWMHTINRLSSLTELRLQLCSISIFDGSIPLVNLTSLQVLDLSFNSINSSLPLWLSNLTTLIVLDLSYNFFQGIIPHNFAQLKNLQYFDLFENKLGDKGHIPRFLRHLCKLRNLNLGFNRFGKLDEFFGTSSNCSHNQLESLDLSGNELVGEIPNSLATFDNLRQLYLSYNNLMGPLPNSIGNLSLLHSIDVSNNHLNGTIPPSFGQLSKLIYFRSSGNSWEGVITEAQLVNLTKLEDLYIETDKNQSLVFNMSYDWTPPFRLKTLYLKNCHIGPQFPAWLRVQTHLTQVGLINAGISGAILKEWISNIFSQITYLDLSNNLLNGTLSSLLPSHDDTYSNDTNHNPVEDSLIWRCYNLTVFNLENNLLSGPIPSNIGDLMPHLTQLSLSKNYLNGKIPSSVEKMSFLQILSLSENQLSSQLLDYWGESKSLIVIDLANNNLFGEIPNSIGLLTSLRRLILSNNHLHGEIPKSLQNCSFLVSIDLSGNRLNGSLPSWIGGTLSKLFLINLRSNFFNGTIPRQWCDLPLLRVLVLSNNNLSGQIPSCLYNWTAFVYDYRNNVMDIGFYSYVEKIRLDMKGRDLEYDKILKYVLTVDLSRNRLSGEIPSHITNLTHLGALNLSHNDLVGSIPKNIGDMRLLETLDLSSNHFSGQIPSSLSSLTLLVHLNLSFNNLTGRVPRSTQLQTLEDPSIYEGNPSLCGSPLQTKCPGDENENNTIPRTEGLQAMENVSEMFGFYMSMAIGFPVGLNILFFTILVKKSWRASYFGFIDRVNYNILDIFVLIEICVRRRIRRWTRN